MYKRLANKTVLITGAGRGIGASTALRMAEEGARVYVADLLEVETEKRCQEINHQGYCAFPLYLDVTSENAWKLALEQVTEIDGHLDILVNNAGCFLGKDFEDASLEEWRKLVDVNMTSVFLGTKLCAPLLRKGAEKSAHGSVIVNLSSIAGLVAAPNDPLYGMAKGGVTLFTRSSAISFTNKGDRIRVNSVHPGVVNTAMGQQVFQSTGTRMGISDVAAIQELTAKRHPLGRLAEVSDVVNTVLFLASDEASFMTGVNLPVDGGYTAQ